MSVVFVFGLPKKSEIVMKIMLHEYFVNFGKIINISVPNTESGKCKRHAFVFFEKKSSVVNVLKTREHRVKIYTIMVDKSENAPDLEYLPPMPAMPVKGSSGASGASASSGGALSSWKDIEEVPKGVSDSNPFPAMEISYSPEIKEWAIKEGCTMAMTDLIDETVAAIKGKDEYATMMAVEEAMDKIFHVIRFAEENLDYSKYHRKVFEECCSRILKDEDAISCLESVKSALCV